MEKHVSGLFIAFSVLALILVSLSGLVGYNMGNEDNEIITEIEYRNVSVTEYIEVPAISQLELAKAEFLQAVDDEEDEAGNDVDVLGNYNFDEIEVIKVYDEYSILYDGDETTVDFKIRLKFDDGDDRVKEDFEVTVTFEEDEDTIVEVA